MRQTLHPVAVSSARMTSEMRQMPKALCMVSGQRQADRFIEMTAPAPEIALLQRETAPCAPLWAQPRMTAQMACPTTNVSRYKLGQM